MVKKKPRKTLNWPIPCWRSKQGMCLNWMRPGLLCAAVPTSAGCGLPCAVGPGRSWLTWLATVARKVAGHFGRPFLKATNTPTATVTFGPLTKRFSLKKRTVASAKKAVKRTMSNAGITPCANGCPDIRVKPCLFQSRTITTAGLPTCLSGTIIRPFHFDFYHYPFFYHKILARTFSV